MMSSFPKLFHLLCIYLHYLSTIFSQNNDNQTRTATVGYGGMVGSAHYLATEAGLEILRSGGNAADAALAVQMTLNLVQPMMSGIGGGCFILYYDYENDKKIYAIDGREEAPSKYHSKIFCKNPDCLNNLNCDCFYQNETASYTEKRIGGLSVGVPGTLYAFKRLHYNFGKSDWEDSFKYVINKSFNGFQMYNEFYNYLNNSNSCMRKFNSSFNLYYNNLTLEPKANIGELFINKDFGYFLQNYISKSPDFAIQNFYNGIIADEIVDIVSELNNEWIFNNETVYRPGLMTKEDISGYRAVFREVVESNFGPSINITDNKTQYKMYGMNMPSSGGVTVQYLMNLMYTLLYDPELNDLNGINILNENISSSDNVHYLISAQNIAFADRNQYMSDNDFHHVPVDGLLDFSYIRERGIDLFAPNYTSTPIEYGYPDGSQDSDEQTSMINIEKGTSHFFIVDQWNNIATVTTTIEGVFGSCIVVPQYGFLLNNELTDFDSLGFKYINDNESIPVVNGPEGGKRLRVNALDIFDDASGDNNIPDSETSGGKRPRSSMSPSLILNSSTFEPILSVGSPGGSTIISTTFSTIFNILIRKLDTQISIDSERIWSFNNNDIRVDQRLWINNPNLKQELINRGYNISNFRNASHGTCQAVKFIKSTENHCKNQNFYLLYGGADDQRWSTANVKSVCNGNDDDDNISVICSQTCIEISSLTNTQRISLIVTWIIVLIIVLCIILNRERIRKWKQNRLNKKKLKGYFDQNDVDLDDQYIGNDNDNHDN